MRKWLVLWLASLITVAGLASALTRAQAPSPPPPPFTLQGPPADARVVSGPDIGFRVESVKDGRAIGTLVVRVNGAWMPTAASVVPKRLASR